MARDTGFPSADAENDFSRQRRRAELARLSAWLTRQPADVNTVLPFDEVVAALGKTGETFLGLTEVEVSTIVGSVDRTRDFDRYFRKLIPKGRGMGILKQDPDMADADVTSEYMMDNVWVVGSREEVVEKLAKLNDDMGGFGVLLAMGHEWEPRGPWTESMGMLIQDVMPKLSHA